MVEKNSDVLGSYGHSNNRHKAHVKPKTKSALQMITNPVVCKKQRKLEDDARTKELVWHLPSDGATFSLPPNMVRQGSPNSSKPRQSPSKEGSPRTSPSLGGFYAGAKFSEPPSPAALPKPPMRWTASTNIAMATGGAFALTAGERADNITSQLKMLLNVSA